jgi:hypothetical protein
MLLGFLALMYFVKACLRHGHVSHSDNIIRTSILPTHVQLQGAIGQPEQECLDLWWCTLSQHGCSPSRWLQTQVDHD